MEFDKLDLAEKIGNNKIDAVLEILNKKVFDTANSESYRKRLTLLKSKFKELKLQSNANLIDKESEFLFRNRLIWDLLKFIDDLPNEIVEGEMPMYIHEKFEEPQIKDRIFSALIDFLIASLLTIPLLFIFLKLVNEDYLGIKISAIIALVITFYQSKDMVYGRSIGKRIMKLSVKDIKSGKDANEISSLIRNLTLIIFPAEFLFMIISFFLPSRRLGDFIANTIVIKTPNSLPLIQAVRFDIRRYSFTKEMWIAILIGGFSTILNGIIIYYIVTIELKLHLT